MTNATLNATTNVLTFKQLDVISSTDRASLLAIIKESMNTLKAKYNQQTMDIAFTEKWNSDDKKTFYTLSSNKCAIEQYDSTRALAELKAIERNEKEQEKTRKQAQRLEKIAVAKAKKQEYENSHIYFEIGKFGTGIARKQLGGYIISNTLVIGNYTSDGYILVTIDKLGRLFVSVNTRVKDTNGGNCRAKKELLSLTQETIKNNVLSWFNGKPWGDCLNIARNCKAFKSECSNKRVIELVKAVEYNASKYDK